MRWKNPCSYWTGMNVQLRRNMQGWCLQPCWFALYYPMVFLANQKKNMVNQMCFQYSDDSGKWLIIIGVLIGAAFGFLRAGVGGAILGLVLGAILGPTLIKMVALICSGLIKATVELIPLLILLLVIAVSIGTLGHLIIKFWGVGI